MSVEGGMLFLDVNCMLLSFCVGIICRGRSYHNTNWFRGRYREIPSPGQIRIQDYENAYLTEGLVFSRAAQETC